MGALSATWKPAIREKFEPLVPNIEFVEAGNVEALHDAFAETGQASTAKGRSRPSSWSLSRARPV